MISTSLLIGLIIGFTAGRLIPGGPINSYNSNLNTNQNLAANGQNNNQEQTQIGGTNAQTPPTETPKITIPSLDYSKVNVYKTTDGNWAIGSKNAKVIIDEYSDFQCPFCLRYISQTFPQIFNEYIVTGKIAYVFHNYPLNFHPQAQQAAVAAACAGDQNKFWEMHDELYNTQDSWSGQSETYANTFKSIAQKLGLDVNKFNQCVSSDKFKNQILGDLNKGTKKGVSGTPTFFINGTDPIVGAQEFDTFKQALDKKIK